MAKYEYWIFASPSRKTPTKNMQNKMMTMEIVLEFWNDFIFLCMVLIDCSRIIETHGISCAKSKMQSTSKRHLHIVCFSGGRRKQNIEKKRHELIFFVLYVQIVQCNTWKIMPIAECVWKNITTIKYGDCKSEAIVMAWAIERDRTEKKE